MMSKKSPQLRFKGFTDDWEERKLSSGLREYTDRVIVEDDKEYSQISVRNNFGGITLRGSKMGNKIGRKRQAKINLTKYPQTLIFTRQTVEQGGIGWVDKYCDGAIVTENMPTISLDTSVFSKYFLTNLFQTRIFYKNAILDNVQGGSAQIAIHESKFLSSTLLFPNLDEQEKIGKFFKQLDKTIALHQRKLDLLKEQKKGYLQKMFPKNGAKVPELRFAGFADDWELRKLKDVTERVRSNDGRMDLPTLTMSASSGWLDQKDRFSGDISGKEKKNYTLLKKGELSYNHGNSKLAKYGVVFSLTNYEEALVPRVYHSFKALENTSADFIEYMFSTKLPDRELGKLVSSGARMDGLLNINYDDFMNIHISIPNYEEQILMSAFFRKLDETIALHQRKLDLLKEQKKGFLQKMFV